MSSSELTGQYGSQDSSEMVWPRSLIIRYNNEPADFNGYFQSLAQPALHDVRYPAEELALLTPCDDDFYDTKMDVPASAFYDITVPVIRPIAEYNNPDYSGR